MSTDGWQMLTLGEISKSISYGYTASAQSEPVGPKFLRITDIVNGLNWDTVPYCKIDPNTYRKYKLEVGDIVVARTGATTGVAEVIKEDKQAVFASYLIRFAIDEAIADPFFIGYVLKSVFWKEYIKSIVGGSAQPGANAKILSQFEILLPPLPTQRRIAEVLSTLDDKIELNRQMNATLETIARAIFKEWFVEFNFPGATGEMVESELGPIPKGWRVDEIGNVVTVVGGGTPSTKNPAYWEDGVYHFATPKDLSKLSSPILLSTERKVTEAGLKKISSGLLPPGTLLMSSRAPVGYLAISQIPVCVNQGFIAMSPKPTEEVSNYYLLNWASYNINNVKSRAIGTTFPEISKRNFRPIPIIIPESKVVTRFDKVVSPLYAKMATNLMESQTLAALRDTLLPKLMSGEIEV